MLGPILLGTPTGAGSVRWRFMTMASREVEMRALVQLLDLYRQWMAASVDRSRDEVDQPDPDLMLVEFDGLALGEWMVALDKTVDRLMLHAGLALEPAVSQVPSTETRQPEPQPRRAGLRLVN